MVVAYCCNLRKIIKIPCISLDCDNNKVVAQKGLPISFVARLG